MNKLILSLFILALASCMKDDDPVEIPQPIINEGEVITMVELIFRDSADGNILFRYSFRDNDGPGGLAPVTDTIKLPASRMFHTETFLLNASSAETDTISNEVRDESDEHLLVYSGDIPGTSITVADKDGNNLPLGLITNWKTTVQSAGFVRIRLMHQPGGIKNGTEGPGETEVDVVFPVKVY